MHRKSIALSIFLISTASLMTEVSLIRVFDVLFFPNIAYMIITCSLFGYGLAGVFSVIKPLPPERSIREQVGKWSIWFSIAVAAILPVMNLLPFNLNNLSTQPVAQILYFGGMYISLVLPFFLSGLVFANLFSEYANRVQILYFWDLAGAALGSMVVLPFISKIGPGGLLFFASSLSLFASAILRTNRKSGVVLVAASLVLIIAPIVYSPQYFDFTEHQGKRGVKWAREQGMIEKTVWDPISKIDVINYEWMRYIAYDGGSQTSIFYPFNGDFQTLRDNLPSDLEKHFWQRGVLVSHMLKEGTRPDVLVIGSAGGQEIKAALMYGAGRVDGVEMVRAVVELGENEYSDYIGDLFNYPNVNIHVDEGRNFLRSRDAKYDIIQIFSNHTSSAIASGTGAITTNYLQTANAYKEYFTHLKPNGILHINHFYYPKMITTAALAWSQLGWSDFEKHVVVYTYDKDETLPTMLIGLQPWTVEELVKVDRFFSAEYPGEKASYTRVIDPIHPENDAVPLEYFSGDLTLDARRISGVRIEPATDDRPFFNLLDKSLTPFPNGFMRFLEDPFANVSFGLATLHLSGFVALIYSIIFIVLPITSSEIGKQQWPNKISSLLYFSCLGLGFITIEFVFIQMFMHLIGSPLYTYSTVLFVMLFSAGIGSFTSSKFKISPQSRWLVPFIGVLVSIILLLVILPVVTNTFLGIPVIFRIGVAFIILFPTGFFLGMPFPLGILSLENQPKGAIAWAWGMNGLFTVIGGLLAVILSVQLGFTFTLVIACGAYILAMYLFSKIRLTYVNNG